MLGSSVKICISERTGQTLPVVGKLNNVVIQQANFHTSTKLRNKPSSPPETERKHTLLLDVVQMMFRGFYANNRLGKVPLISLTFNIRVPPLDIRAS
jgi:hypothetical protein